MLLVMAYALTTLDSSCCAIRELREGGREWRVGVVCGAWKMHLLDPFTDLCLFAAKITEFCGAPGLGKTQLGIQLAVNVHTPSFLDGAK
jgi:hypothetical protein